MLKLHAENTIIDIPDLNRFQIGDHVIADACAEFDRHEGVIVGIELQRLHGSKYLVPSITLLHDGYLTDGFKPQDLRKVGPDLRPASAPDVIALVDDGNIITLHFSEIKSAKAFRDRFPDAIKSKDTDHG